ncbi:MAG: RuBisCO accumulation factor 1, partial [Microcystis sp.]
RLQDEDELARIIPLVGRFPVTVTDIKHTESLSVEEPFRLVTVGDKQTIVPLPGWQAILKAIDPVAILWPSDQLPRSIATRSEEVLLVIDRVLAEWDVNNYYLVEKDNAVFLQWFDSSPDVTILGELVLILRAKNILDEKNITEPWQMDD